jgi:uncharacterized protein YndB with AHSA1/START domain
MKAFEASTTIHAPAERVWAVLVDTAAWPEWDPSCERIEGKVAPGATIKAFTKLAPGRAFPVKVSELVPNERMIWTGGMPLGLFRGVRSYTLAPEGTGTKFAVREVFSGPMLALIGRSLPDMSEPFQGFVRGLKQRSESVS